MTTPDFKQPDKQPYAGRPSESAYETLRTIVLVLITALLIRSFVAQPFIVEGKSMEPTLSNSEYLIVDKIEYRLHQPKRGDVIVFKAPEAPDQNYIKRIIGLPGETVTIKDASVFVNNKRIDEQYIAGHTINPASTESPTFFLEQKLGPDEYFVMGDNRDHSSDSRRWGPLPKENIVGKAQIVLFPIPNLGVIELPGYPELPASS
ncbi:MAG: signal peptidase I [Patescibacteria group bacterium]